MPCWAALIRHGDYRQQEAAPSAWQPHPLTDLGREQAAAAVPALVAWMERHGVEPAAEVQVSELLRAWQTAEIIATGLRATGRSCHLVADAALNERSVGCLANLSVAAIEAIVRADPRHPALPADWKSRSDFRLPYPGAESLLEAGARVAAHLQRVCRPEPTGGRLHVVVGHGAAFRHAAHHLGLLDLAMVKQTSMWHARPIFVHIDDTGHWSPAGGEWKPRRRLAPVTD